ncbi:MAG TPA: hypothetical protein PKA19_00740 [Bacillota bacterium]|nr:hypothetical protein [Bacillota bacterium]
MLKMALTVCLYILMVIVIAGILTGLGNDSVIMAQQTEITDKVDQWTTRTDFTELEESEPVEAEPTSTLTPDEFDLVCRVMATEAGGEDLIGQEAVAPSDPGTDQPHGGSQLLRYTALRVLRIVSD